MQPGGAVQSDLTGSEALSQPRKRLQGIPTRKLLWVAGLFASATFFLSGFLALFAPLPLILLALTRGLPLAAFATLTNLAIVYSAGGETNAAIFLVFMIPVGLTLPWALRRRWSLEATVALALGGVAALVLAGAFYYSRVHDVNVWNAIREMVGRNLDRVLASLPPESLQNLLENTGAIDQEEFRRAFFIDLPWRVAVFCLALIWVNLLAPLRLNIGKIRDHLGLAPDFATQWKAPEWLIWPTIVAGFGVLVNASPVGEISTNLFKFLLAIAAIQGLSVLACFFDAWKFRGPLRSVAFVFLVLLMLPLVIALGFFDQWFDFRSKFRQT